MKDRVSFFVVGREDDSLRLDRFLAARSGLSRTVSRRLIGEGKVLFKGRRCRTLSRVVRAGDRVELLEEPQSEQVPKLIELSFLHRDRHLAVVDKPAGLPTEPTRREDARTCLRQMEATLWSEGLQGRRLYVAAAHRLDAVASGALALALSKTAARELGRQFAERTAGRTYLLVVAGIMADDRGQMRSHLGRKGRSIRRCSVDEGKGKLAITNWQVVERLNDATVVHATLQTGRTHQIRVHFAEAGHPLLGDHLYCPADVARRFEDPGRLCLHARTLAVDHPLEGERMTFVAPVPPEISSFAGLLGGAKEEWPLPVRDK